ncbi:MAG: polysaccharide deacetylase [Caulobacteraceae bacterium]|nr:polysaccharide deacetylase [Caulobacteraceae bacterium]
MTLNDLTTPVIWAMIRGEIGAWKRAGRSPRFWWRDDDARRPTEALDRLLKLSEAHAVPLALAVIPDVDLSDLATMIADRPLIRAIQHGCDHVDRNRAGGFSAEFNPASPVAEVASAVNTAWERLSAVTRAAPIYAPPWNVMTPNVRRALLETPIRAISLYGAAGAAADGLVSINAHVDVMKWRPARFRGEAAVLGRVWRQLRARRKDGRWDEPIGLLTHHKNLDPAAWKFLEIFLERATAPNFGIRWRGAAELIDAREAAP